MKDSGPKLIYIGDGSALPNVPARNLTQTDIDRWQVDISICLASGLYELPQKIKQAVKDGEESE